MAFGRFKTRGYVKAFLPHLRDKSHTMRRRALRGEKITRVRGRGEPPKKSTTRLGAHSPPPYPPKCGVGCEQGSERRRRTKEQQERSSIEPEARLEEQKNNYQRDGHARTEGRKETN